VLLQVVQVVLMDQDNQEDPEVEDQIIIQQQDREQVVKEAMVDQDLQVLMEQVEVAAVEMQPAVEPQDLLTQEQEDQD
tara:strand:- start:146 stop:379 length:234 start_codon:yes stop_codon:yes gene_type:complete